MNIYLIASAMAGIAAAAGHAYLGERHVLRPMFAHRGDNRVLGNPVSRRVIRWVWHLPSFAWAQIAAATMWFAIYPPAPGTGGIELLAFFGIGVYLTGAIANFWAIRKIHIGNALLAFAALALALGLGWS